MTVRIKILVTNLVIFCGILSCAVSPVDAQGSEKKTVKKTRTISERKAQRQSEKAGRKRRKHAYKIQDKPTRKRMKKTYRAAMRRQKKK